MASIYKNQTKLRIQRTVSQDITGATLLLIKYKKPDGTEGQWTATSSDDSNGVIYYDVTLGNEIDQSGRWIIWAYVTFSDGRSAPGEITYLGVKVEGTNKT